MTEIHSIGARSQAAGAKSQFRKFLFTYRFHGTDWSFEISAISAEEAKERVKVLAFAHYDGELEPQITTNARPARGVGNWLRSVR